MVLTAVDVLTKYWPFGQSSTHLCRAVKASPCFAVYLASLTIVVIALDRYRCIVHSTKKQLSNKQVWQSKVRVLVLFLHTTVLPCYISDANPHPNHSCVH